MIELAGQRVNSELALRFEDLAQDGRMRADAIPVALGAVWRGITLPKPLRRSLASRGILPILTRLVSEAGDGPFAVDRPMSVTGGFQLCTSRASDGAVLRLLMDMDAELTGPKGRTHLPPPADAGAVALAGSVKAEHVFTRPFAAPEERKVLSLDIDGESFVPEKTRLWRSPESTLEVASEARAIDADFVVAPAPLAMGLAHTDSNQHVNSLVYARLFEEAVLRRLATMGRSRDTLARAFDIAYRRPSFAGDVLHVRLRLWDYANGLIATGSFFAEGKDDRARVFVHMRLEGQ